MQDTMVIKQCLDKLLSESDTVFIVPHERPDMDALGASLGMASICKKNNKKYYIVINEELEKIESATRRVLEKIGSEFNIIKLADVEKLITDDSLMLAIDVNKTYRIHTRDLLDRFKNIMIIDHHKTDEHTIKTDYIFTDETLSSTCEEVSRLVFAYDAPISNAQANCLLGGIILDTNRHSINVSPRTFDVDAELLRRGANTTVANGLFLKDFKSDRLVQRLIDNTIIVEPNYAIAPDKDDSGITYKVEDIGKAADYLLDFNVMITFAIARIDEETISVSARSKGQIDVSRIMKLLSEKSGGSPCMAAAQIKGKSISEVRDYLNNLLSSPLLLEKETGMKLSRKND